MKGCTAESEGLLRLQAQESNIGHPLRRPHRQGQGQPSESLPSALPKGPQKAHSTPMPAVIWVVGLNQAGLTTARGQSWSASK